MNSKGQALTETIIIIPVLLLLGWIAIEGSRLIALKGILAAVSNDSAHNLSSTEIFNYPSSLQNWDEQDTNIENNETSINDKLMQLEEKNVRTLLQPYKNIFGWNSSAAFPLRFYATRDQTHASPGFSTQINACIPLIATIVFSNSSTNAKEHRNCLGQFERTESAFTNISGNIRLRVASFAPRMASYEIFNFGIAYPRVWIGVDRIPGDRIAGSESSSNNAIFRLKAALARGKP